MKIKSLYKHPLNDAYTGFPYNTLLLFFLIRYFLNFFQCKVSQ